MALKISLFTGHFLLTDLLLETMKKTACESKHEGRIVNVSSRRHKFSYNEGIRFDKINDEPGYIHFKQLFTSCIRFLPRLLSIFTAFKMHF